MPERSHQAATDDQEGASVSPILQKSAPKPTSRHETTTDPRHRNRCRLFVSNSTDDADFAKRLESLVLAAIPLEADAVRCTSLEGLTPGANTAEELRRELKESQAFVGIVSKQSMESMYVQFEMGARWGTEKHFVPVFAPGTPSDALDGGPLSTVNGLRSDKEKDIQKFLSGLAEALSLQLQKPDCYGEELQALLELQGERDKFIAFFGESSVTEPYNAYFARAQLAGRLVYSHKEANKKRAQPKGFIHMISFEEVTAITELDRLFRSFGKGLVIDVDRFDQAALPERGCLSVGLGFNNLTTRLSFHSKDQFRIYYRKLDERDAKRFFVKNSPNRVSDGFTVRDGEDQVWPRRILENPDEDYALLSRILYQDQPYVICAGRSAEGTSAALRYLAHNWLPLYEAYKGQLKSENFATLVIHEFGCHNPLGLKTPPFQADGGVAGQARGKRLVNTVYSR